jgi:hypothetical protein
MALRSGGRGADLVQTGEKGPPEGVGRPKEGNMTRIGIGFGVLGATMNSVVQTRHAASAIINDLGNIKSASDMVNALLFELSHEVFLGLLAFILLVVTTWLEAYPVVPATPNP